MPAGGMAGPGLIPPRRWHPVLVQKNNPEVEVPEMKNQVKSVLHSNIDGKYM